MISGTNYKIRIRSSYKNITSDDYISDIEIDALPKPKIVGSNKVCLNSESYYSVDVNSTGGYDWSVIGGIINEGIGTKTIKVKWNQDGIGRIYVNVSNGTCSNTDSINIIIYKLPEVTLAPFKNNCINDASYALSGGLPLGGRYFVDDVQKTKFEPYKAGIGKHKIEYVYSDLFICQNSSIQYIEVFDIPSKPIITKVNDLLESNYDTGNQWYMDGNIISGADKKQYKPEKTGIIV